MMYKGFSKQVGAYLEMNASLGTFWIKFLLRNTGLSKCDTPHTDQALLRSISLKCCIWDVEDHWKKYNSAASHQS